VSGPQAAVAVSEQESAAYERILLASEGRAIPDAAVTRVVELAAQSGASIHVFSIARVHGVAFGLPNPGLVPTRTEWREQRDNVTRAVKGLERRGLRAEGHVLGTRKAAARICEEALKEGCEAIVMAADSDRHRIVADMLWSQEPQRVRRRAKVPVYLVVPES
jgi:nucleotide-binding universal stress UspA family protein